MKSRITRNICLLLWFIMSIVLLCLGLQNGTSYILSIILGTIVGIIGIDSIYKGFYGWIIFNFGIGIMLYPISRCFGYNLNYIEKIKELILTFCLLLSFELFFDDSIRNKNAKKRCTVPFQAKCVSFARSGEASYIPIYRYHIGGKASMFYGTNLSSSNPRLGEVITVFVNKKNENDVYCPTAKSILMVRYMVAFAIISFCIGAIVFL